MNHLELLKKLLIALEEETPGYSPIRYLHMRKFLSDEEFNELVKLEAEMHVSNFLDLPHD